MLDQQKDIDAVVIATPDHMHAAIALAAMDLGKHVYVQKPLTWSVAEARQLASKAKSTARRDADGQPGPLVGRRAHRGRVRVGRRDRRGPRSPRLDQPSARLLAAGHPASGAAHAAAERASAGTGPASKRGWPTAMAGNYPKPEGLAWDLFLGPAPYVDYHPVYHPFNWRGWVDWGCGALGDMGAHLMDHSMWALDLGYPTTIETVATPFNGVCFPNATMTIYEFPARDGKPPVKLTWYDGGPAAAAAGRARRETEILTPDGRRAARRQQGQADARHLRQKPAPAARVAARVVRQAEAEAGADSRTRATR